MEKIDKRAFVLGWVISIISCATAFALLITGKFEYGIAIFCILPFSLGFITGVMPNNKSAFIGMTVAVVIFLAFLFTVGLEGFVCILMAIPILLPFILLGWLVRKYLLRSKRKKNRFKTSLIPFAVFLVVGVIENEYRGDPVYHRVSSSIQLPFSSEMVYDAILHVDTVNAQPSIFHQIGLPLPLKCHLTEEKIGGLRICAFDQGSIIETITEFKRGEILKMDVTAFNMKGRDWLRFNEDIYSFNQNSKGTELTRITTYHSELKPRFYWEHIEALTIHSEQDLVFRNLLNDLNNND